MMYLEYVLTDLMPHHSLKKPRSNFIEYCDDLKKSIGGFVDRNTLEKDFGFSFSELLDQFILHHEFALTDLKRADYCVIISVGCEYDPVYSHLSVYLAEKYGIACDMLDVMEQGALSLITALHFLRALLSEKNFSRAVILGLDQRVMPVVKSHNQAIPAINAVSLLSLVREFTVTGLRCVYADMLSDQFPFFSEEERGVFIYTVSTDLFPLFNCLNELLCAARQHTADVLYVLLIEDCVSKERGVIVLQKENALDPNAAPQ